jgi:hypothetical protein
VVTPDQADQSFSWALINLVLESCTVLTPLIKLIMSWSRFWRSKCEDMVIAPPDDSESDDSGSGDSESLEEDRATKQTHE